MKNIFGDWIMPAIIIVIWLALAFQVGAWYGRKHPNQSGDPFTFCLSTINGIKSAVALTPHENNYCNEGSHVFRIYSIGKAAHE